MIRRWLVYGVLGCCALLVGATWLSLSTERGSLWLLSQLPANQLRVTGLRGSLLDEMQIERLSVETAVVQIELSNVRLRLNFARLLLAQLEVSYVAVEEAQIIRHELQSAAPGTATEFAGVPLRINFPAIEIQQVDYWQGDDKVQLTKLQLAGSVVYKTLEVTDFAATYTDYHLHGDGSLTLVQPWAFSGHYQILAPQGELSGEVYGDQRAINSRAQAFGLTLIADLQLAESLQKLTMLMTSPRLELSNFIPDIAGFESLSLGSVDVRLVTDFSYYDVTGAAEVVSNWLPALPLIVEAAYANDKLTLATLNLETGEGGVGLAGIYTLADEAFAGELTIVDFPLSLVDAYLETHVAGYSVGAVKGQISAIGEVALARQHLTLAFPKLTGEFNQHRLGGSLNLAGSQLDDLVVSFDASLAKNQLLAALDMPSEELRIEFSGEALGAILPGTQGTLALTALVKQWRQNLWVEASVDVKDLAVFGGQVGNFSASVISVKPGTTTRVKVASSTAATNEYRVQVAAQAVRWADQPLGNLLIGLQGSLNEQRGSITWQRDKQQFSSQVEYQVLAPLGGLAELPSLARLTLFNSELSLPWGKWRSPSLALEYADKPQLKLLAPSCWESISTGQLCIDSGHFARAEFQFGAHLRHMPIDLANLPGAPALTLVGQLDAKLDVAGDLNAWRGQLVYNMPQSRLSWSDSAEDQALLDVGGQGSIDTFAAVVDMQALSSTVHQLTARLSLADLRQPNALELSTTLVSQDLALITAMLPFVAEGQGEARASVDYRQSSARVGASNNSSANSSLNPAVLQRNLTGQVNLGPGVSGFIPALNLRFSDLSLEVMAPTENDVQFRGSVVSGAGNVALEGKGAKVLSPARQINATLKGDQFTLVNSPALQMVASPDLAMVLEGQQMKLTGSLRLDSGRVEDSALQASTRGRSQDVVLSRDKASNVKRQTFEMDVALVVGDQVQILLYGLDARVSGALRLRQSATRPLHVEGALSLKDGIFSRYGVEFQLERGRLVYNGSLTNPTVDVVARREIDGPTGNVVVKLMVSGAATNIQSKLVASPAMSEAEALSYLLLGRPLQGSSGSEATMLANAALSFGLKKAVPITAEIQSTLGLDQLSLGGQTTDSAAIVAGKRLSKNVYMEYNYGIFSRIGGLLLSYQLTEQLSLEAQSGTDDSLEIIYKF
ncbi:MAG: autotransporter translocation and assembly factor TamB [Candidatus Azotimanducaceae bacterium]